MFIKKFIRTVNESFKILNISILNTKNNLKYLRMYKNSKCSYIEYNILLLVHSIEKGLSLKEVRYGFGKAKIYHLLRLINLYNDRGYNIDNYAFKEAIAVLDSYIKFHKNKNYKIDNEIKDKITSLKSKFISVYENNIDMAGIKTYLAEELKQDKMFDFDKFISTRHSIRNFNTDDVSEEIIDKALEMAQKAPSACNRQPNKVYYSLSPEINSKIDDIIPGNQGFFGHVNKYLIVTCNMEAFGSLEINQWYINGGIYSTYLLLALHSMGIGTCVFQWASIRDNDKNLKKLANIPDNEQIILVIGIGKYPDEINVPIAARKDKNEVKRIF